MDVFRVFDSVNYIENMKLGIDAVGTAGGIVEAACCYTGDVSDPKRGLYDLEYYLNFVRALEAQGIHCLAIKGENRSYYWFLWEASKDNAHVSLISAFL